MKTKNIIYLLNLVLLFQAFTSCKKQIAIDPPVTKIVTSNVFNNDATATAAVLGLYPLIVNFTSYNLHRFSGLSSDELYTYATDVTSKNLYINSLNATADGGNLQWRPYYSYIYQVNAAIEGLNQYSGVNSKVKQQLIGEAEFVRAYLYFHLINLYGDVPLIISTDYSKNSIAAKADKNVIYQQIIQDLLDAQSKLSSKYVDATDTASTVDRIRPTSWAASALLARIYLYAGNAFDKAEDRATNVINNSALFSLPSDLNSVFKKNSSEAIWQIPAYTNGATISVNYTYDGAGFVLISPPGTGTTKSSVISTQLMKAFETGDKRLLNWIGTFGGFNFPYKYKNYSSTDAFLGTEYEMMLRLGEQYLIRAEARVMQGNTAGAVSDLNTIRNRAGLANYAGATDQASLIAAISHERQVELFTEGDRWFNLRRTGTLDAVMGGATGVCAAKGGVWSTNWALYPIPVTEPQNDPNLLQNPGY